MKRLLPCLIVFCTATGCGIFPPINTERPPDRTSRPASPPRGRAPRPDAEDPAAHIRTAITSHAEDLLGLRYKFGGNNPRQGFDCSGFVLYLYQHAGIDIERVSREQAKQGKRVDPKRARPGDLVFFKRPGKPVHHVSVVKKANARQLVVVHATNSGVIEEDIMQSRYWKPLLYQVRNVLN